VTDVDLTEKGKEIFGKEDLQIFQMHKDIIFECPPGLEVLAYNEMCAIQGMYQKGRIISVQGHPEYTEEIVREMLEIRHASGILNDEIYNYAKANVGRSHDGVVVTQAFLRFVMED